MKKELYLNISQITKVRQKDIYLKDIAKIYCEDSAVANKCNALKVKVMHEKNHVRYVGSVLDIIKMITEMDSTIQINNIGEVDFIIDYQPREDTSFFWEWIKTAVVCCVSFFGAGFAIMTFNNDASVADIFRQLYYMTMGTESSGFTILEISYSVGLAIGIIGFFNHFAKKKVNLDPTPLEVEMRLYENDISKTTIQNNGRKEAGMDAS